MIPDSALESRGAFERWCDSGARASCNVLGSYRMYLLPKDRSITPHLVREGYWEAWVSLAIARFVKTGMYCVDAGANMGYYTVLMAARGAERVMAVEPSPDTAALLRDTVAANGLSDRVEVVEVALGPGSLSAELLSFGDLRGSDSLYETPGYEVTDKRRVSISPLDLVASAWPRVDFVKMDVEGFESEAWYGMRVLRTMNPQMVVCMEVSIRPEYDLLGFLHALDQEKRLGVVDEDGSVVPTTPRGVLEHPMMAREQHIMVWLS